MKKPEALVPLKAAQKKPDDPMVAANITNAVDRLTFLKEHEGVKGKAKAVLEGIWIIAGSSPNQKDRLERAMKCINSADAETRRQVYAKALKSPSQFIRNSAMFAAIKNGDTIQVSEADQTYYEGIRAILARTKRLRSQQPRKKKAASDAGGLSQAVKGTQKTKAICIGLTGNSGSNQRTRKRP